MSLQIWAITIKNSIFWGAHREQHPYSNKHAARMPLASHPDGAHFKIICWKLVTWRNKNNRLAVQEETTEKQSLKSELLGKIQSVTFYFYIHFHSKSSWQALTYIAIVNSFSPDKNSQTELKSFSFSFTNK